METEERRRRGGPADTSRKGGTCVKVRTAEEEARRREELKEMLREKLELEKRALKVVERLLEDSVAEDFLIDCAKFITPANYEDTVEERFIAKLCGYPICPNKLGKIPNQLYKISTKTNRVYDITERKCYCSNFCYKASKEYELQISKTPLWLRVHESPSPIRLLKKGASGKPGEEVLLSERRLKEDDIENPPAASSEEPPGSQRRHEVGDQCQSSDSEREQEVVSKRQGQRVHWADLPEGTDKDDNQTGQSQNPEKNGKLRGEQENKEPPAADLLQLNAGASCQEQRVEEATGGLSECSMSKRVVPNRTLSGSSQAGVTASLSEESKPSGDGDQASTPTGAPSSLGITRVGMSKRGAAGVLEKHSRDVNPGSIRLNLLEYLKRTLKDWCTEETVHFLYGADHSLGSPFAHLKETEEEELDEDDLEDDDDVKEPGGEGQWGPSAAAPDYETLQEDMKQMQLRVSEFYKGTWILPEEEELNPNKVNGHDPEPKDPVLPLVDSQAQSLIQKRITVEKLTSCLRNIVGPVGLAMSDISTDLFNLVRTFRFTNTNIIHKGPEWTLLAVVLLHLLSAVSPVVQEALEMSASVRYLRTRMEELGLQDRDLLDLVEMLKASTSLQKKT